MSDAFETKVAKEYGKKLRDLSKTLQDVNQIVRDTLTQPKEYAELVETHLKKRRWNADSYRVSGGDEEAYSYQQRPVKGAEEVLEEYKEQIDRKWAMDYEEELKKINDQITCYEGDVREGADDLEKEGDDLQEKLDTEKKEDPDLEAYEEELEEVDWGEDELDEIEPKDPANEIRRVIKALEDKLDEIEAEEEL